MRRVAFAIAISLVSLAARADDFDATAVRAALDDVPYRFCGTGGAGEVRVTLAPDGRASAEVSDGAYTEKTSRTSCQGSSVSRSASRAPRSW